MAKKTSTNKTSKPLSAVEMLQQHLGNRPDLTRRELQVAIHIGVGLTCPEAAEELEISTETVRTHLASLRKKTGLHRKTRLTVWATANVIWLHDSLEERLTGTKS